MKWIKDRNFSYPHYTSDCGRFAIYDATKTRRIPRWMVFQFGIGVVDMAGNFKDAKSKASSRSTGRKDNTL